MPADLSEGIYLAGVGMGLVFLTLSGFLLIMLAMRRLFPDEGPVSEDGDVRREAGSAGQGVQVGAEPAPTGLAEPPVATGDGSHGGLLGAQIAAVAAAAYIAMEQEEIPGRSVSAAPVRVPAPPSDEDGGGTRGRLIAMRSQGHRPPPYGQKPHSAYSPRGGRS